MRELCTIILQILSQFVVAPTRCIINAMDLKIFSNTIMLLKVDCFAGVSNRSNIDELVINSMSGCNCKNYKLIITITNLTITLHENSVLLF